ncbi:MAG TPA: 30S ribosome-binding factor RbfA [Aggregatilineales bacterium]|nr:30S ribosome-binding factor RbfA [Anaerolineae bacterium]HUN09954.1 30S ribosome-binding factor RbfA [Aggregatilineales bacterium]
MSIPQQRVAEQIQSILSTLLLREVSDPRLKQVTVTSVKLDVEMQYATIQVNALGDESRQDEVMAGLERAKGFLRREVSKRLKIRNAPELSFKWDESLEYGEHMHQLLKKLEVSPSKPKKSKEGEHDA